VGAALCEQRYASGVVGAALWERRPAASFWLCSTTLPKA